MDIINRMNEYYPSQEDGNGTNGLALGRLGRNVNIDIMLNPQQQLAAGGAGDQQMNAIFQMCKNNQWDNVLNSLKSNPDYITRSMSMTNNIETSVLHQAITSKGSLPARVKVIDYILDVAPTAAQKKNGYQSLPLHVICQRNTKMSSKTKERLIVKLIEKYPQGLNEAGGVGQRTPIHIVFTGEIPARYLQFVSFLNLSNFSTRSSISRSTISVLFSITSRNFRLCLPRVDGVND